MNKYFRENKKQVAISAILMFGLIVGVYLVQKQQIFESKANQEVYNTFTITQTSETGEQTQVGCQDNNCTIDSPNIEIKVDVDELERLSQE